MNNATYISRKLSIERDNVLIVFWRQGVISCSMSQNLFLHQYSMVFTWRHRDLTQSWEENLQLKTSDHWDAALVGVVVDEPLGQPLDRALGSRLVHLAQTPASHEMLRQLWQVGCVNWSSQNFPVVLWSSHVGKQLIKAAYLSKVGQTYFLRYSLLSFGCESTKSSTSESAAEAAGDLFPLLQD